MVGRLLVLADFADFWFLTFSRTIPLQQVVRIVRDHSAKCTVRQRNEHSYLHSKTELIISPLLVKQCLGSEYILRIFEYEVLCIEY